MALGIPKNVRSVLVDLATVLGVVIIVATAVTKFFYPCMGEGDRAGCEEFNRPKELYEKVSLGELASYASSRRWTSNGIEWLAQTGTSVQFVKTPPTAAAITKADQITVLIHGFRGIDTEVTGYFGELAGYLATENRYNGVLVVFDWPSTARDWLKLSEYEREWFRKLTDTNPETIRKHGISRQHDHDELFYQLTWEMGQYDNDKRSAREIGAPGLAALVGELTKLNNRAKINIVAHSMGCYTVEQALETRPDLAERIKKIIWLAPDVPYDVFGRSQFKTAIARIESLDVFFSRNDGALKWPSRLANGVRPLGAYGPTNNQEIPANVTFHDLTIELAPLVPDYSPTDDPNSRIGDIAIHTVFLKTKGPVPEMIRNILRESTPAKVP